MDCRKMKVPGNGDNGFTVMHNSSEACYVFGPAESRQDDLEMTHKFINCGAIREQVKDGVT